LDVESLSEEERLLRELEGVVRHFKVGLRLFTAHGRRAVEMAARHGGDVFLDLKLHDIPQTVVHAIEEARAMGVYSLSLHLLGGSDMLRAAARVAPRPRLWGVTVLTSLSDCDVRALHPRASVRGLARRLARLARDSGLDGIICSGREVPDLRKALGGDPCFVVPGIRPSGHEAHDQKRVVGPGDAARLGIRYAVVGRPITKAHDVRRSALAILEEIEGASAGLK
jgi:orotidine-5'-phosphate decarboxylase